MGGHAAPVIVAPTSDPVEAKFDALAPEQVAIQREENAEEAYNEKL